MPGKFGYGDAGGDTFEFIFDVTGGDAAGIFGSQVAVLLNAYFASSPGTDFTGSFNSDWGNVTTSGYTGIGSADNFAIPEPASIALLAAGGLVLGLRRRR